MNQENTEKHKCSKCQKELSLPFIRDYCFDCFEEVEKDFREKSLMVYYETNEKSPDGQIGWNKEKNAWVTLWDNKGRVVYSPKKEQKKPEPKEGIEPRCDKCQGEFTKKDGKLLQWVEKDKESIKMCCACKDKLEKNSRGLQHANIPSSALPLKSSDPGMESGTVRIKNCEGCGERVVSHDKKFSDHDCHKTHLEKHIVPNFPEDDSKAKKSACLFCQMTFEKEEKNKTKCWGSFFEGRESCGNHYYEEPKRAWCQMKHQLFKKHFPNYKSERERERAKFSWISTTTSRDTAIRTSL